MRRILFLKKNTKMPEAGFNHLPLGYQSRALDHSATQTLDIKWRKVEFIKLFNDGRSLLSYCTVLFHHSIPNPSTALLLHLSLLLLKW